MSEMEDKLGNILSNPQLMQQIMTMAQSLGQSASDAPAPKDTPAALNPPDPQFLRSIAGIAANSGADSNQKALLSALSPYVNRDKLQRLEKAMQAVRMAQIASSVLGNGGLLTLTGR